jgi:hypothetical protein
MDAITKLFTLLITRNISVTFRNGIINIDLNKVNEEYVSELMTHFAYNNIPFTFKNEIITIIVGDADISNNTNSIMGDTLITNSSAINQIENKTPVKNYNTLFNPTENKLSNKGNSAIIMTTDKKENDNDVYTFMTHVRKLLIDSGYFQSSTYEYKDLVKNIHHNSITLSYNNFGNVKITFGYYKILITYDFQSLIIELQEGVTKLSSFFFEYFNNFLVMIISGFSYKIASAKLNSFVLQERMIEITNIDGRKCKFSFRDLNKNLPNNRNIVTVGINNCLKHIMSYNSM